MNTTMKSYKVFTTDSRARIDADSLYSLVNDSTSRWSDLYRETRLNELKHGIARVIYYGERVRCIAPLTDEVLNAIRKAALSFRYDIRSDDWRLEHVGQLIEQVDEALAVPEGERACTYAY